MYRPYDNINIRHSVVSGRNNDKSLFLNKHNSNNVNPNHFLAIDLNSKNKLSLKNPSNKSPLIESLNNQAPNLYSNLQPSKRTNGSSSPRDKRNPYGQSYTRPENYNRSMTKKHSGSFFLTNVVSKNEVSIESSRQNEFNNGNQISQRKNSNLFPNTTAKYINMSSINSNTDSASKPKLALRSSTNSLQTVLYKKGMEQIINRDDYNSGEHGDPNKWDFFPESRQDNLNYKSHIVEFLEQSNKNSANGQYLYPRSPNQNKLNQTNNTEIEENWNSHIMPQQTHRSFIDSNTGRTSLQGSNTKVSALQLKSNRNADIGGQSYLQLSQATGFDDESEVKNQALKNLNNNTYTSSITKRKDSDNKQFQNHSFVKENNEPPANSNNPLQIVDYTQNSQYDENKAEVIVQDNQKPSNFKNYFQELTKKNPLQTDFANNSNKDIKAPVMTKSDSQSTLTSKIKNAFLKPAKLYLNSERDSIASFSQNVNILDHKKTEMDVKRPHPSLTQSESKPRISSILVNPTLSNNSAMILNDNKQPRFSTNVVNPNLNNDSNIVSNENQQPRFSINMFNPALSNNSNMTSNENQPPKFSVNMFNPALSNNSNMISNENQQPRFSSNLFNPALSNNSNMISYNDPKFKSLNSNLNKEPSESSEVSFNYKTTKIQNPANISINFTNSPKFGNNSIRFENPSKSSDIYLNPSKDFSIRKKMNNFMNGMPQENNNVYLNDADQKNLSEEEKQIKILEKELKILQITTMAKEIEAAKMKDAKMFKMPDINSQEFQEYFEKIKNQIVEIKDVQYSIDLLKEENTRQEDEFDRLQNSGGNGEDMVKTNSRLRNEIKEQTQDFERKNYDQTLKLESDARKKVQISSIMVALSDKQSPIVPDPALVEIGIQIKDAQKENYRLKHEG